MADLKSTLREALKKPMYFALAAKGSEGTLLADKKKIPAKEIDQAKKACRGGSLFKGRCKGEDGTLVFEVGKEPPKTLAALIKKIIKQEAQLSCPVEVRVAADLADEAAAEADGQALPEAATAEGKTASPAAADQEAAEAPPHAPPAPVPGADASDLFKQRLSALMPKIKETLAGAGPAAQAIKLKTAQAGMFGNKRDFEQANRVLDEVEELLANGQVQDGQVPDGREPSGAPSAAPQPSMVVVQQARLVWEGTRKKALAGIKQLKQAILAQRKDDPRFQKIQKSLTRLDGIVSRLDSGLADKLDEALNAQSQARPALYAEAVVLIGKYRAFVDSDPVMAHLDNNGFVPLTVRAALSNTLALLATKIGG